MPCRSVSPVEPPVSRLKTPTARSSPLKAGCSSTTSCGIPLRAGSGISSPGLSPASSCSRIPISKSQDDLIKNVHLRTNNKANNASKTRPNSYRNSINSPRNSKLISRNSVEVLSYNEPAKCVESVCNSSESGQTRKFYGQIASQRDNKTGNGSRIAKQADVALTRKVGSRIPGPKIASSKFSTSSSSSSSSSSYSSSSTVLHASSTSASSSGSDAGSPDSGELMPMIDGTKKPVVLRSVENEPRPSPKDNFLEVRG